MRGHALTIGLMAALLLSCGGGNDSAMEFRIETAPAMPGETTGFVATGAAVDQSSLCASGEASWGETLHAETGEPETAPPQDGDVMWVHTTFTCDDGTGELTLRAEVTVDNAALEQSIVTGDPLDAGSLSLLAATGDYEDASVTGTRTGTVVTAGGFDDGVTEVFEGTLTLGN